VIVTLHRGLQLVLSRTIRIGDTKYDIYCSFRLETQSVCQYWTCVTLRDFHETLPTKLLKLNLKNLNLF
jgi:hypothetical protein